MAIDVNNINNSNNIRRSPSSSKVTSRSPSIFSSVSSIPYYERIVINNNFPNEDFKKPINSSQLSYKDDSQKRDYVSKMTDLVLSRGPQHVSNEVPTLNTSNAPCVDDDDDIINIQLLYDFDWHTKLKL